jgi:hypothetical protein
MSAAVDYAWGEPDAEGIALGLKVTSGSGACAYRIAVANRSSEPRAVVLFATLDDKIRTRIVAKTASGEQARPAVMPAAPISSNIRMAIELEPGQVIEREGQPASFGITGDAKVHLVLGGVPGRPEELTSGEVRVTLG